MVDVIKAHYKHVQNSQTKIILKKKGKDNVPMGF